LIVLSVLMLAVPLFQKPLGELAYWLSLLAAVPILPVLFQTTMKRRWDRYLGDLSYPIYISHLLVMWIGEFLLGIPLRHLVYFAIPATIPVSILLLRLQERFDAYRHSLVKAAAAPG
jgi:peptidoglycan/LPS O-acetylase OafA/YrhL